MVCELRFGIEIYAFSYPYLFDEKWRWEYRILWKKKKYKWDWKLRVGVGKINSHSPQPNYCTFDKLVVSFFSFIIFLTMFKICVKLLEVFFLNLSNIWSQKKYFRRNLRKRKDWQQFYHLVGKRHIFWHDIPLCFKLLTMFQGLNV